MITRTASANWARVVLIIMAVLTLLPLIYHVGISLKTPQQIFDQAVPPFLFPPRFDNYQRVLEEMPVLRFLFNSLVFAGGVTLGQLAIAIPAAFAFSYFNFRFRNLLMSLVILSLMVPFVVTYVPNYLLLAGWRMLNTLHGMILPMLGVSLGFGIFLLRQNFMVFPREVTEAAMIDGANSWQILWRVLVPANIAPIAAVAVYVLINTWNQFIWPLLIGGGAQEAYTLTVAVSLFYSSAESGDTWGALLASSVLAFLPTVVIYLFMRKSILRTFTEGAVKG